MTSQLINRHLDECRKSGLFSDLTLRSMDGTAERVFRIHKVVVSGALGLFQKILPTFVTDNEIELIMPYSAAMVESLIELVYTGQTTVSSAEALFDLHELLQVLDFNWPMGLNNYQCFVSTSHRCNSDHRDAISNANICDNVETQGSTIETPLMPISQITETYTSNECRVELRSITDDIERYQLRTGISLDIGHHNEGPLSVHSHTEEKPSQERNCGVNETEIVVNNSATAALRPENSTCVRNELPGKTATPIFGEQHSTRSHTGEKPSRKHGVGNRARSKELRFNSNVANATNAGLDTRCEKEREIDPLAHTTALLMPRVKGKQLHGETFVEHPQNAVANLRAKKQPPKLIPCGACGALIRDTPTRHRMWCYYRVRKCSACGVRFLNQVQLKGHLRSKCALKCTSQRCNFATLSAQQLEDHLQSFHKNWKGPTPCSVCGKVFRLHSGLIAHTARHNGTAELFKCVTADCVKVGYDVRDIYKHMLRSKHTREFGPKNVTLLSALKTFRSKCGHRCFVLPASSFTTVKSDAFVSHWAAPGFYFCQRCFELYSSYESLAVHFLWRHFKYQDCLCGERLSSAEQIAKHYARCNLEYEVRKRAKSNKAIIDLLPETTGDAEIGVQEAYVDNSIIENCGSNDIEAMTGDLDENTSEQAADFNVETIIAGTDENAFSQSYDLDDIETVTDEVTSINLDTIKGETVANSLQQNFEPDDGEEADNVGIEHGNDRSEITNTGKSNENEIISESHSEFVVCGERLGTKSDVNIVDSTADHSILAKMRMCDQKVVLGKRSEMSNKRVRTIPVGNQRSFRCAKCGKVRPGTTQTPHTLWCVYKVRRCEKCRRPFSNQTSIIGHLRKSPCSLECDYCSFTTLCNRHLQDHTDERHSNALPAPAVCAESQSKFPRHKNTSSQQTAILNVGGSHQTNANDSRAPIVKHSVHPTCEACGKQLSETPDLHRMLCQYGVRKCELCGLRFQNQRKTLQHLRSGTCTLKCDRCYFKTLCKRQLSDHIEKMHPPKLPVQSPTSCTICGKVISRNYFKRHMQMHNGTAMLYKCISSGCVKGYFNKLEVMRHLQKATHVEEVGIRDNTLLSKLKQIRCRNGFSSFVVPAALYTIVKRGDKVTPTNTARFYYCLPKCNQLYSSFETFRVHVIWTHDKIGRCRCGEQLLSIEQLAEHYTNCGLDSELFPDRSNPEEASDLLTKSADTKTLVIEKASQLSSLNLIVESDPCDEGNLHLNDENSLNGSDVSEEIGLPKCDQDIVNYEFITGTDSLKEHSIEQQNSQLDPQLKCEEQTTDIQEVGTNLRNLAAADAAATTTRRHCKRFNQSANCDIKESAGRATPKAPIKAAKRKGTCGSSNQTNKGQSSKSINNLWFRYTVRYCEHCGVRFTSGASIRNHIRLGGECNLTCALNACRFKTISKEHLQDHIDGFHKGFTGPTACTICGKMLLRQEAFSSHMAQHYGTAPLFKCSIRDCMKAFFDSRHTNWHVSKNKQHVKEIGMSDTALLSTLQTHKTKSGTSLLVPSASFVAVKLNEKLSPADGPIFYFCTRCCQLCSGYDALQIHLLWWHYGIRKCSRCDLQLKTIEHLVEHHRKCDFYLNCQHCPSVSKSFEDLQHHMVSHDANGTGMFKCHLCPKKFKFDSKYEEHMTGHSGVKQFRCEICKKGFRLKGALSSHMQFHVGIRNFSCSYCEKSFIAKADLQRHILLHQGLRQFQCEHCGVSFTLKGSLTKHRPQCEKKGQ